MRFFSRVVFICNCCFILAVLIRWIEMGKRAKGNFDGAIPFQPLESTLVVLGYGAIFINAVFLPMALVQALKRKLTVPRWLMFFNVAVFCMQVYYFFFSNY